MCFIRLQMLHSRTSPRGRVGHRRQRDDFHPAKRRQRLHCRKSQKFEIFLRKGTPQFDFSVACNGNDRPLFSEREPVNRITGRTFWRNLWQDQFSDREGRQRSWSTRINPGFDGGNLRGCEFRAFSGRHDLVLAVFFETAFDHLDEEALDALPGTIAGPISPPLIRESKDSRTSSPRIFGGVQSRQCLEKIASTEA